MLSRGDRLKAAAIAAFAAPVVGALGRTYRWVEDGAEHLKALDAAGTAPILALWHGRILPATLYFRDRGVVAMTSQNFDGEWIARILHKFGFGTARGSSSRGGARALVQLRRDLGTGKPAAFTVDGPRGPARVVQPGVVFLAGATGHPIVPYHVEAGRYWTLNSWDRTQIPKPFSTVALVIGEPIRVESVDEQVLETKRTALASALIDLERRALSLIRD